MSMVKERGKTDMGQIDIYKNQDAACILIEPEAYEGVRRIGARVAQDMELVTAHRPKLEEHAAGIQGTQAVVAATLGKSPLLEAWQKSGKLDAAVLAGKREIYLIRVVEQPFPENPAVEKALVIAGSDKRGTIYGLFRLSELCGVSPLVYWGDVRPEKKQELVLDIGDGMLSKEPSVKYRGFFINDEWPAFGNWCMEHFGGINAKVYEEVFLFLLRMKGNYMWPAMWDSVFSDDGPGLASAELADLYGVIMGLSHHEPMCRAGAEWQRIYRQYGEDNTWSFVSNSEAITEFWRDGILRNRPFENLITIGMRGENDSRLLSADAAMADNIQVVKNAILAQHKLLREHMDRDLAKVPRMLAIYKEVEDFYYGDGTCQGLKDWEELDDVIFMLCDDNFGNVRGLPSRADRPHPGGYGMYYHFDYHGAPISYEWQNSTRLTKTWEQMTTAYEHGVRELWIVNVGDLKGAEYPLSYFMELAYDYEKWSRPNQVRDFAETWIEKQFGSRISPEQKEQMLRLLDGWTRWSAARRPEAMNPQIYHPCHYREGDRVWEEVNGLMELAEQLHAGMPADCLAAYESILYYPCMAGLNLILMQIEAGKNAHLAARGSLAANAYGERVKDRIGQDARYVDAYHRMLEGKWNHMMDSAHTGFRNWDDRDWRFPVIQQVIPVRGGKIAVGFRDSEEYHLGSHWQDNAPICNDDFAGADTKEVLIDLDSRGDQDFTFAVQCDKPWLHFAPESGRVSALEESRVTITVTCDRQGLTDRERALIEIPVRFADGQKTVGRLAIEAAGETAATGYPKGAFLEHQGVIAMEASHFARKQDVEGKGFRVIEGLGRMGDAVKAFPVTESWIGREALPCLRYDFAVREEGDYVAQFCLAPRNPRGKGGHMRCQFSVNEGKIQVLETVPPSFYAEFHCAEWNRGVLDNIRIAETEIQVKQGLNHLCFYAGDPEIVLERIVLHRADRKLPESYLGPVESARAR